MTDGTASKSAAKWHKNAAQGTQPGGRLGNPELNYFAY